MNWKFLKYLWSNRKEIVDKTKIDFEQKQLVEQKMNMTVAALFRQWESEFNKEKSKLEKEDRERQERRLQEFREKHDLSAEVPTFLMTGGKTVNVKDFHKELYKDNVVEGKTVSGGDWREKFYTKEEIEEANKKISVAVEQWKEQLRKDREHTAKAMVDGFDNEIKKMENSK